MLPSGDEGTLYLDGVEVTPMRNWTYRDSANVKTFGANDGVAKQRHGGKPDASGTFEIVLKPGISNPISKGSNYDAEFHLDATGRNYGALRIFIEEISVDSDIDDGDTTVLSVTWGGQGTELVPYGVLAEGAGGSSSGV